MHLIYPLIELPDDPAICRIVAGVVGLVETILPGHVHSYYLLGSQVDGATLETSDIDMSIVLRAPLDARPLGGLNDVLRCCSKISPYPIDVKIYELQTVRHLSVFGRPLLLFGTDLRPQLPPLSDAASLPIVLQFCLNEIASCIDAAPPLTLPVKPPNESDRYLGLANRLVRQPDGSEALGLKWLATSILWPAKALIFMKSGQWIPGKGRDLTAAFDAAVGPPWSWLVTAVSRHCRGRWQYRLPRKEADKRILERICQESLGFYSSFLAKYRDYWAAECHSPDEAVRTEALKRIGDVREGCT